MADPMTQDEYDTIQHAACFLDARGLNSRAMLDWNTRLMKLAALNARFPDPDGGLADRYAGRTEVRLLRKLEKATVKQLRKTGLYAEWAAEHRRPPKP